MKAEEYTPICKQVSEKVKLLDHICRKERERGTPTPNQERLLIFEALEEIYEKLDNAKRF